MMDPVCDMQDTAMSIYNFLRPNFNFHRKQLPPQNSFQAICSRVVEIHADGCFSLLMYIAIVI